MTVDALLAQLSGVRARGTGRWTARCPGHNDRNPSLSVREGERGILLKCFAGCSLDEICRSLGIEQKALFFDELDADPRQRRTAARLRISERQEREACAQKRGRFIDACKHAERFIRSRQALAISSWTDGCLDRELNLIADAYAILEEDPYVTEC